MFLSLVAHAATAQEWHYNVGGQLSTCSPNTAVNNLCTGGEHPGCFGNTSYYTYNTHQCFGFPSEYNTPTPYSNVFNSNHWQPVVCPAGTYMSGACSSATNFNCNNRKSGTSIRCVEPKAPMVVDTGPEGNYPAQHHDGRWLRLHGGQKGNCPAGTVSCGMCSSGKDPNCISADNQRHFGLLKCCPIVDCSASRLEGHWVFQESLPSPFHCIC